MTNKFKHTLPSAEIVVRQVNDQSTWIEDNAGAYFPLVRIRDTVVDFMNVVSCRLDVGQSFLPSLTVTIDDENFEFRETDFVKNLDILTIFIGSAKDTINLPIKNDYLILEAYSNPGSSYITFVCELYVPKLYHSANRVFDMSSIDALEKLAKECMLGFTTNITAANDSMKWIQYQNNIDFIHDVTAHAYIDETYSIRLFVDQFANLTVVNLTSAITEVVAYNIEVNPVTGDILEKSIPLVLQNNKLDTENPAKITEYTPNNNYGELAKQYVTSQKYSVLSNSDYTQIRQNQPATRNIQLDAASTFTAFTSDNVHQNFMVATALQANNLQTIQGTTLQVELDWSIQSLFMLQVVPVEIYNIAKRTSKDSMDSSKNLEDVTNESAKEQSNAHIKNEQLSGNCLIQSMTFDYYKSSASISRLQQSLTLFKIQQ